MRRVSESASHTREPPWATQASKESNAGVGMPRMVEKAAEPECRANGAQGAEILEARSRRGAAGGSRARRETEEPRWRALRDGS
jgi:hypothetical protein